ncbi:MAG: FG-GAP repeat domain-containing protein [Candidatus Bathyarchaeales archaeon]
MEELKAKRLAVKLKLVILALLAFSFLGLIAGKIADVKSNGLTMETEQHWDTFGVGSTCVFGGHNLALADVDGDNLKEIITGGVAYYVLPNGSRTKVSAPFKIWSWNGEDFKLKGSGNWTGYIRCVYAGDVDGDGSLEIVTSGGTFNGTSIYSSLQIWTFKNHTLTLEDEVKGITVHSTFISDVNGDGQAEILAVGGTLNGNQSISQLFIFKWDGEGLTLYTSKECFDKDSGQCSSVYAFDLNGDNTVEIVTAGYIGEIKNSSGHLAVWQLTGTQLSLKDKAEWQIVKGVYSVDVSGSPMGNTMASNLKVADVDHDSIAEIVTCGFTYNGNKVQGQLRIWNYTGAKLSLEESVEWTTLDITHATSLSIADVDGDGKNEVVTSGYTAGYNSWAPNAANKSRGELKVWSWDGKNVTLEQSIDWIAGEAVSAWNVGAGDIDNDAIAEIVTVGCMQTGSLCDPDLRIWVVSIINEDSQTIPYLDIVVYSAAVIIIILLFVLVGKRKARK